MVLAARADAPLRFGVCGTGYWAEETHLPVLAAMPDVDLIGVWGRNDERSASLADRFGIRSFSEVDALFDSVDAISFVLPPYAQGELALRAAIAGKHLLLEKPLAATSVQADALKDAVNANGVASLVFMTRQFVDEINAFVDGAVAAKPLSCRASFRSRVLLPDSPYHESAWRREPDAILLDAAPHPIGTLVSINGPVLSVAARQTGTARYDMACRHGHGLTSKLLIDYMDEGVTEPTEIYVVESEKGRLIGGPFSFSRRECFERAVKRLSTGIEGSMVRPSVSEGCDIVRILDAARRSVELRGQTQQVIY